MNFYNDIYETMRKAYHDDNYCYYFQFQPLIQNKQTHLKIDKNMDVTKFCFFGGSMPHVFLDFFKGGKEGREKIKKYN